jgi:hypothetical protein
LGHGFPLLTVAAQVKESPPLNEFQSELLHFFFQLTSIGVRTHNAEGEIELSLKDRKSVV